MPEPAAETLPIEETPVSPSAETPEGYQVRLDVFEGPLDLLLFLIRKKKIDIHDIPIAAITRNYLEYLDRKTEINLDREAEFLFVAALLIYIKSQMLLPRETDLAEHEDPRLVLVNRLLEYQKIKAACSLLREREDIQILQWKRNFIPPLQGESELEPVELSLFEMSESFFLMMKRRSADETRTIRGRDVSVEVKMKELVGLLQERHHVRLPRIFRGQRLARRGPGLLFLHPRAGQVPGGGRRPGRALPDYSGLAPQGQRTGRTIMNSPLKNIVESLIFVSQEPLTLERIQAVLEGVPAADIQAAVDELIADTAADDRGVQVIRVGGGWLFSTKPAFDREIRRLLQIERKNRLSSAGLETLAAIAYRQPVTQAEISAIRGVDSTSSLKTLLEKGLIKIVGRKKAPGNPLVYRTSDEFLLYLGLNGLDELPSEEEIAKILQEEKAADA